MGVNLGLSIESGLIFLGLRLGEQVLMIDLPGSVCIPGPLLGASSFLIGLGANLTLVYRLFVGDGFFFFAILKIINQSNQIYLPTYLLTDLLTN